MDHKAQLVHKVQLGSLDQLDHLARRANRVSVVTQELLALLVLLDLQVTLVQQVNKDHGDSQVIPDHLVVQV